jgi:anti-sigma factor RsiW
MNCTRARFLLYTFLDGEVPAGDGWALDRHLAFCAPCAARARSARSLAGLLRSRLRYDQAPLALRQRLQDGRYEPRLRPRYLPLGLAASILLLLLPLVADQPIPPGALLTAVAPVAVAGARGIVPVSRRMTGTFVCLQCEGSHDYQTCPAVEPVVHELGFCADNGETFRMMTTDSTFANASVGQAVTVEGVEFPESGFLRASRVGY